MVEKYVERDISEFTGSDIVDLDVVKGVSRAIAQKKRDLTVGKPKNVDKETERRRTLVAEWHLRGLSIEKIQAKLERKNIVVSKSTIRNDIDDAVAMWRERRYKDTEAMLAQELARLNELEAQNWDAWDDSRSPSSKKSTETGVRGAGLVELEKIITEERDGDPRFLVNVLNCIKLRCKILGIEVPQQHDVTIHIDRDPIHENV